MESMNNFKIKNNFSIFLRDYLLSISLIVLCFLSDRISKIKIIQQQENGSTLYINDFINFDLVWNTGIGFGLFNSLSSLVYNVFTFLIGLVLIFLIYLIFKAKFLDKIFFSLILGGALGNFYDRIFYYAVPDFIDLHFNKFHWFTFNIADIFITLGIMILIIKDLFLKNI
mgnify:CR=1 FL=1|tara:strand:- start:57 stop:566 length:510 start_codon:yes stop_codon:yes gene_type:complete